LEVLKFIVQLVEFLTSNFKTMLKPLPAQDNF
jgi:hypothetical protein